MADLPTEQLRALLREWMRRFELNRRQTARALEVREHSVQTVLGGHEPNVDLADTLCRAIGAAVRLGGRAETEWRREWGRRWRWERPAHGRRRASVRLRDKLRTHINGHKLEIRTAARMADIPEFRIHNLLRGHVPGIDTADSVCHALGMVTSIGSLNARRRLARTKPAAAPVHRAGEAVRPCPSALYD